MGLAACRRKAHPSSPAWGWEYEQAWKEHQIPCACPQVATPADQPAEVGEKLMAEMIAARRESVPTPLFPPDTVLHASPLF